MMGDLYRLLDKYQGVINPAKDAFMGRETFFRLLQVPQEEYLNALDQSFASRFKQRAII